MLPTQTASEPSKNGDITRPSKQLELQTALFRGLQSV